MTINWTKSWRNLGIYRYYDDDLEILLDKTDSNEWNLTIYDLNQDTTLLSATWEKKKYAINALIEFIQKNYAVNF